MFVNKVLLAEQALSGITSDGLCMRLIKAHKHLNALRLGRIDEFIFSASHAF